MPVPNIFTRETRIESAKVNENFDNLDFRTTTIEGMGIPAALIVIDNRLDALEALGSSGVFITPQDFGAVADGASHPLSATYANLAAAQVDYPFATALTQEIDYCAFKKMCLDALGQEGAEHADVNANLNKPMWIPAGNYMFGNDTLTIRNTSGMKMWGAGKRATKILGNVCIMAFDGLWYSDMRDMSIICQTNTAGRAFDIDGNVPAHPYATRGTQGNKFVNMVFDGGFSDYAVQMNRQGIGSAQGSENIFENCHFQQANLACYWQTGNNALNNTFFGGNFQSYNKDGIHLEAGHINVYSVGFQSTVGYTQIINDGYDINAQGSGVADKISIAGCRTESLRFLKSQASTPVDVRTITHNSAMYTWSAGAPVALNTAVLKIAVDGKYRLYRVTTAGVSAGAEPVWPNTGTVNDGTAVWTQTDYEYIHVENGSVDRVSCRSPYNAAINNRTNYFKEVSTNYIVESDIDHVLVDATAGPVTITIPATTQEDKFSYEKLLIIKKVDTSSNAVTLQTADFGPIEGAGTQTIAGGSRGWIALRIGGGGSFARQWNIVSKSVVTAATPTQHEGNADYTALETDTYILIDCSAGTRTVTLPMNFAYGKEITIMKYDAGANPLNVVQSDGRNINLVVNSANIAGGSRGFVRVIMGGNGGLIGSRWFIGAKGTV